MEKRLPGFSYSLIEDVQGRGRSGVRHGTAVWPELNILYVIVGDESQSRLILEAVREVKTAFPGEGIKLFQYHLNAMDDEVSADKGAEESSRSGL